MGSEVERTTASRSTIDRASLTDSTTPSVRGKFIFLGEQKLYVRGVTYGTFRPRPDGHEYPSEEMVEQDFSRMAANGVNTVRTYTVPPSWLLDAASRHGLRVLVGLAVERFVGFLADKRKDAPDVEELVRAGVRACAGHPAVLGYAVANEIPAAVVRWHGRRSLERYIERLYHAAKSEDPSALVTYVNYPTTEYLQLPFLDLVCFNTYLESRERFESYIAHLQNIAGDRPLLLTEIGLDSVRNGELAQFRSIDWQVRAAFASGCAGAFVYSWTDEWHRGGEDVEDWGFGLTRRDRSPKPALAAVRDAFADVPLPRGLPWPRISVVVCTHNGSRTIRDCLTGLSALDYPNFEVIVVNDGSNDGTAAIVGEFDVRLITTPHLGLSGARNTGMNAATGEIVAYIDDDAFPDPHWLTYLAVTFMNGKHVAVGGPNIPPRNARGVAECVANAPGNPAHVLLSDHEAEHSPGCNMSIRKDCLQAIGGFDTQFHVAGDDVDVCWRLQERGWTLGFSPAAMVWHHRRGSVRAFWKQQFGYGKAEAMLERKWPKKYNVAGHLSWAGQLYGSGVTHLLGARSRIYFGTWGTAPFQSIYRSAPGGLLSLSTVPEWYLVILALAVLTALGVLWRPLFFLLPLLVFAVGLPLAQAILAARRARFAGAETASGLRMLGMRILTAFLHLLQPLARLSGRLKMGLTPWRRRAAARLAFPRPRAFKLWTERWQAPDERLRVFEEALRAGGGVVVRGGGYDRWDLEVRGGILGGGRILMAVEEHGAGRQLVRLRSWPTCAPVALVVTILIAALSVGAAVEGAWLASAVLGLAALLPLHRTILECASAAGATLRALRQMGTGSLG